MYKFLLIAALLPAIVFGQTPFRACPGGKPTPSSLNIQGCSALPCSITSSLVAQLTGITSPVATSTVNAYIAASVLGVNLGLTMPANLQNACAVGITGASCPLTAGESFNYGLNMPLPIVGTTAQVQLGLTAADGSALTCIEIDAIILA